VIKKREAWKEQQKTLDPNHLVFLDESSVNAGMTRLYGRARTNERVCDYVPDVRFERTSILSTIRLNGEQVPIIYKGTLNSELFVEYLRKFLTPTLGKDDIVVMDNCTSHKSKLVREAIVKLGINIIYLPPYSPDFNPIEMSWSKMKSVLRQLKPRSFEEIETSMKFALDSFTQNDLVNWFTHDGYLANL
jgi:transposase